MKPLRCPLRACAACARAVSQGGTPLPTLPTQQLETAWTADILRSYLIWVKSQFQPVMTPSAELVRPFVKEEEGGEGALGGPLALVAVAGAAVGAVEEGHACVCAPSSTSGAAVSGKQVMRARAEGGCVPLGVWRGGVAWRGCRCFRPTTRR